MEHIVIIGNGISGITAARHIRKQSDKRITVISGETDYFFSRTALMYIYMGHMKYEHTKPYEDWFWKKNRIELKKGWVKHVDFDEKQVLFTGGEHSSFDTLILATGSKPNKFGWPGQDLPGVQGLYSYQDLETLEENSKNAKRAVVIGGGLIGIELAEMLMTRGIAVTFLVREKSFWSNVLPLAQSEMINRHMTEHHIDLRLESELKEIVAGADGRVSKVITTKGEEIECEIVGLTAGVRPNVDFLKDSRLEIDKGIIVNRKLATNIPNVYALGDCAQFSDPVPGRRNLEQVWYTGKIMGETVAKTICGVPTEYAPGHWFNSAKFLDIEYQTYGWVSPELKEEEAAFYWENQVKKLSMYFVFHKASRQFIGVNTFGIRLRHEVFDRWLNEKRTIEHVLQHLKDANFDSEFYKHYEKEIVGKYNTENKTSLSVKAKSWQRILSLTK